MSTAPMAVRGTRAPLELRTLLTELRCVHWSGLATELGVPEYIKRTIEQQYSNPQQRLKEVFDWWMEGDREVIWERIAVALGRLHYYNLRDQILDKYCSCVDRQALYRPNDLEEVATDDVGCSRRPGRQVRVDWEISEAIADLKVSFGMTKCDLFEQIRRHLERNPFKKARRKARFINTLLDFIEKDTHDGDKADHKSRSISLNQACDKWADESDVFHVKVFKQFVKPYFQKHPGIKKAALDLIVAHEQKIDEFNGMAKLIDLRQCIMNVKPHLSESRCLTLVLSEKWTQCHIQKLHVISANFKITQAKN